MHINIININIFNPACQFFSKPDFLRYGGGIKNLLISFVAFLFYDIQITYIRMCICE